MLIDIPLLIVIGAVFLLAGSVKGVVGLGLPTVSLALLTIILDLPTAMALLLAPSFVTNLWQALAGQHTVRVIKRIWPFLLFATISVWIGALVLRRVELTYLSTLLGFLVALYAASGLVGFRLFIPPARERWVAPALGLVNGVLTGMTGSFVFPGVMYLQTIGLPRDALIQAMGLLFTLSTLALGLALKNNDLLNAEQSLLSLFAVPPALFGMYLGQRLRRRLSEAVFRRTFFIALLMLGLYIVTSTIWSIQQI